MAKRGKYGKWSEEDLQHAIRAYSNNIYGLNQCQRVYGVPKATIKRHSDNKNIFVNGQKKFGTPTTFKIDMEKELVSHILALDSLFFGYTITDIRKLAYDIAEKYSLNHKFNKEKKIAGKKWFYLFMKRNPNIVLRQPEATSMARAKGFNKENVMSFFDLLEKIVDQNKLTANRVFNVDESGFTTVQKKPQKVISQKGKRYVGSITSGERGINTTIVCCTNAAGFYIPPMIIFKRKRKAPELEIGAPSGSIVEISDTGYINSELFVSWLKHFHSCVKSTIDEPVLLLLDGHTTHSKNLEALLFAKEHGIILLQLPGHTTHRLQPLDVAFFKPLGLYYIQTQEKWLRQTYGKTISQYQVTGLLNEAYGRAATIGTAENGFRGSGIWPVNRHLFEDHHFIVSNNLNRSPTPNENVSEDMENDQVYLNSKTNDMEENKNITVTDKTINRSTFLKVIEEISPIPKTQRDTNAKPKKSAQKAIVLTSSPYKNLLESTKIDGVKTKNKKIEKSKELEKKKILNEQGSHHKKKKLKNIPSTSKNVGNVSWYCPLCQEEKIIDMVMCKKCSIWFHEECLGLNRGDTFEECHWCTEKSDQ
ncbi:uncharacterized protein LOC113557788 [Rhopalosiphum maidis]|uniref:uncharacterized protein LOC113557788 n=1 Tax=Rhopalosiphum maidis TaxID=43146 RepID=UPI000EFED82A|nr:uncharacterized protein LOC113557788 [Rhopalosiphum maidis]